MIELTTRPKNAEHFDRLLAFASEVLDVCEQVGVAPVLNGSLAVLAYAGPPAMEVHDIDFSCPESCFPRLERGLESIGVACTLRPWHVLQARRGDLEVEFDSAEHWMQGIPDHYETLSVGGIRFRMVGIDGLRELYRRGLADTAGKDDDGSRRKNRAIEDKLRFLDTVGV